MVKISVKKKKTALRVIKSIAGVSSNNTFGGNLIAVARLGIPTFFWMVPATYFHLDFRNLEPRQAMTAQIPAIYTGTGGPDHTVLDGGFLRTTSVDDVCDGEKWTLASGASSAIVTYATSSPMGSSYELSFIPTGKKAANITFGRFNVYEIIFGEDSFRHLSLKDLQTGKLVTLFSREQNKEDAGSRINMGLSLSTSTLSVVRIDEKLTSESSYHLEISVNGKQFTSKEITLLNQSKYQSLYLGLIDTSIKNDNQTGLVSQLLDICP